MRTPSRLLITGSMLLACTGCPFVRTGDGTVAKPPHMRGRALAHIVASPEDLPSGPAVHGTVGDVLIENSKLRIVISRADHKTGFCKSGGNVIDVAPVSTPGWRSEGDHLNGLLTYFDDRFPRQAVYEDVTILKDGSEGGHAIVRARGADSDNADLLVTTDYALAPDVPWLKIVTTVTNRGAATAPKFELGDAIEWGFTQGFAPGVGRRLAGKRPTAEWIGGIARGAAYAIFPAKGDMQTRNGHTWTDVIFSAPDIAHGAVVRYERYFAATPRGLADAAAAAYCVRGQPVGEVRGVLRDAGTKRPIHDGIVYVSDAEQLPVTQAKSDRDGAYSLTLPPGRYALSAGGPGRGSSEPETLEIREGQVTTWDAAVPRQGKISFEVRDARGRLIPAKLTFEGVSGTPNPYLGPPFDADGAENVIFCLRGKGESIMAPGQYRVTVSRGVEYTTAQPNIVLRPGQVANFNARLARVVDTRGYVACDFHQHGANSHDSATSLEDRITSNVCEGIELMAATDHDYLTDYTPAIERLGVSDRLKAIVGDEVTTTTVGHFNAFPLTIRPSEPGNGAVAHEGRTPAQIFAALRADPARPIIQVNHPRSPQDGCFRMLKLDAETGRAEHPDFDDTFDVIEVFNGKHVKDAKRVLADWYGFLNQGRRYTATGNSDTHTVVGQEAGYPRTFVYVGDDRPAHVKTADVIEVLRSGHNAIVTNGPFPWFEVNGRAAVGSTVTDTDGSVDVHVRVQAAPWVDVTTIEVVVNGRVARRIDVKPNAGVMRYDGTVTLSLGNDSWIVVTAEGEESLAPVVPGRRKPVKPFSVTNPVWIDRDGNGRFDPLRLP